METEGVQAVCGASVPTGKKYKDGKNENSTCTDCDSECFEALATMTRLSLSKLVYSALIGVLAFSN